MVVWRAMLSVEQMVYDLAGVRGEMMVAGMVVSSVAHSVDYWVYAKDSLMASNSVEQWVGEKDATTGALSVDLKVAMRVVLKDG